MNTFVKATPLMATAILAVSVQAATVTFDTPVIATNTSVLDIQFTTPTAIFVEAANVGDSSAKSFTTAGGSNITFAAMQSSLGSIDMPAAPSSTSGYYNGGSQWNASIFTNTTDLTEWGDILRGNAWHNNVSDAARPLTLRLANLTVGQPYTVSLFAVDQRSGDSQTRTQRYAGGFSGGTFTNGLSDSFSTTNAIMVIGTFTADATYQDIFIQETDGIGNDDTTLAAYALFKVGSASDNDGDGLPGAWEALYGLDDNDNGSINPNNGATGDPDSDTYNNLAEYNGGSNPTNALSTPLDTDADGLLDSWEMAYFSNLIQTGTDDYDGDYATNEEEETGGTDPTDRLAGPDSDSDAMVDAWEIHYFTDTTTSDGTLDSDGDGLTDYDEFLNDSDPTDPFNPYSGTAVITWGSPVTVTKDSDILTNGTLLHAGNFRSDSISISVTNGSAIVLFENRQAQNAMGDLLAGEEARVIAGAGGRQVNAGLFDSSNTTVSASFESVLDGSAWENTDPGPAPGETDMILRMAGVDGAPLVDGVHYQVQLFYSDDRYPTRSQVYHDNTVGYTPSDVVAAGDSTYVVGTFTAGTNGYQDVYIQNVSGDANFPVAINAYVLRQTTASGPTVAPNISSFSIAGGSATLTWDSETGVNYGVMSKSSLTGGTWTEVTNVPGAGASSMATIPAGSSQEFFRIEGN